MSVGQVFERDGVAEDGTQPAALVAPRQSITVPSGAAWALRLHVRSQNGAPFDATAKTFALYVARAAGHEVVLTKTVAPGALGKNDRVELQVLAADTDWLGSGTYIYEVWVYPTGTPSQRVRVVAASQLRLEPSVSP